ncbi:MAG: winged helix-turn-helix domain-containing protein [Candidatus Thermoplasmatota archaeon]
MGESATDVALTLDAVRTLATGPRLRMLRLIAQRPLTLSDLSKLFPYPKSTLHTHLIALLDLGFVTRRTDERVWVYYVATEKGTAICQSSHPRIVILLAASLVAGLAAGVLWTLRSLAPSASPTPDSWAVEPIGVAQSSSSWTMLAIMVTLAFVGLAAVSFVRLRRTWRPESVGSPAAEPES